MLLAAKGSEDVLSAQSGFYCCHLECGKPLLFIVMPSKKRKKQLFALIVEEVTAGWVIHISWICVGCGRRWNKSLQPLLAPA